MDNPEGWHSGLQRHKKRPIEEFPAMPPQDYLSEQLRLDLAHYILEEVGAEKN
jgi:hypothetical protein